MTKEEIEKFLETNPTEQEAQAVWDKHLKDIGFVLGMGYACNCGCYRYSWTDMGNPPVDGAWYFPGHGGNYQQKETESISNVDNYRAKSSLLIKMNWMIPVVIIVVAFGFFFGVLVTYLSNL
jgi:hypothetical protein